MAAVLWLAGIMAADPRRLPAVVPDLVGTGIELQPSEVQDASRQAKWGWKDEARSTLESPPGQYTWLAGELGSE